MVAEGGLSPATIGLGLQDYEALDRDMAGLSRQDGRMCILDTIVCFNESQAPGYAMCVWEN